MANPNPHIAAVIALFNQTARYHHRYEVFRDFVQMAARQSQSKPLLISLHDWLVEKSATLSKKSRLGEAFAYVLNQWDALCYYCDDGLAEADNNAAERALRAV